MPAKRVLVVEDDVELGDLMAVILETTGYAVELIRHGRLAHQRLTGGQPDLPDVVVLDLHLPGMSGVDILQAIRADAALTTLPVLVTTADIGLGLEVNTQADEVIYKPYEVDLFLSSVARLVARVSV